MKSILHTIEPRDAKSGLVNVIVDTPRGSRNEFRFDETPGCFKLSRILPAAHSCPCRFGSSKADGR